MRLYDKQTLSRACALTWNVWRPWGRSLYTKQGRLGDVRTQTYKMYVRMFIYTYTHTHTYVCIYIYIYTCIII